MLLMIPAWVFFPEIVFSGLWLWISAENASQPGEAQRSCHSASICQPFSGSHEVQGTGHLEMWKLPVHSRYPQPACGSETCKQTKDRSKSWVMHWWGWGKCYRGYWIGYVGFINWGKGKWNLGRVRERHWDIFWKSRKILIPKLTGQNGSGQLIKGGSWTPFLSRKW